MQVVQALTRPGVVDFQGQFFTITGMPGASDSPVPPPRIMLGGYGDVALRIAATRADIVNINAVGKADAGPSAMDRKVELVTAAADGRAVELSTMIVMVVVSDDARIDALNDRIASLSAHGHRVPDGGLAPEALLDSPAFLIGSVDAICEQLISRRERWGISYYLISHPDIEAFAPVIERLASFS